MTAAKKKDDEAPAKAPEPDTEQGAVTTTDEPNHATTSTDPTTFSTLNEGEDGDIMVDAYTDDDGELVANPYVTEFEAAADPANEGFVTTQEFPHATPVRQFITGQEDDSATFGATEPPTWDLNYDGPPHTTQVEPKVAYSIPDPRQTGAGLY